MKKRSICFFCSMPSLDTGMPLNTLRLIEHFSGHEGYDVHVVLPSEGAMSETLKIKGIRYAIIPFVRLRSFARFSAFAASLLSAFPARIRLIMYLRKNKIELVHFSDIIDMLYYPAARIAGCKSVMHLRMCISSAMLRLFYRAITALCADKVVCISEAVRRHYGPSCRRAATVYNPGPDMALFDPAAFPRDETNNGHRDITIMTIGKFVEAKGHMNFVRMAHRIETQSGRNARYIIIGDKVPHHEKYFNKVMSLVREYGLEQKCTVQKPVAHNDMPCIMAQADIYVHVPDCQEGLGGAILEALAMQIPVVAFDSGGVGECFTHGLSGYIVPHQDVDAAAEKTAKLISEPQLRLLMGKEGRREVEKKFNIRTHFAHIEDIYNELLGTPG